MGLVKNDEIPGWTINKSPAKVGSTERGRISICTFDQLVSTAEKRLFGLRAKLSERYDEIPGMELFKMQGKQMKVEFK
jgi:hypothetical protein